MLLNVPDSREHNIFKNTACSKNAAKFYYKRKKIDYFFSFEASNWELI